MDQPALELERFATLCAELDAGTPRDELCAREGITVAQWVAAQEAWLARMADETARKRFVLTNRYNNAFVARRRAITHGGTARPARKAEPAKVVEAPRLADPIEPAEAPVIATPSFAIATPEPMPIAAPVYVAPVVVPPSPAVVPEPRPPRAATVAIPVYVEPAGAPLPFKQGAPPAPPPPEPPRPPPQDLGGTTVGAISPFAEGRVPLPFQATGAAAASPSRPPVDEAASTTVTGSSPLKDSRMALPFQPGAPVAIPPAPVKKPSEPPRPPPEKIGEATIYGAVSPFAKGASPLPFKSTGSGPSPIPQPRLTLEQFASLTAEIAVAPHAVAPHAAAQIRARYGFDEASHAAEAEAHNRRFNADKALFERYLSLVQQYRDYVARAKR